MTKMSQQFEKMELEDVNYFYRKFQREAARSNGTGSENKSAAQLIAAVQCYMEARK